MARILTEVTGREIAFYSVPIEDVRKASTEFAIMLESFDRVGYDARIAENAREFGIEPTRLRDGAGAQSWDPAN